jgi:formylglycine-generating enzyme
MALVGASCVDRWEASLVVIETSGASAETPWSPYRTPKGQRVRAVSRPSVIPQAHISMAHAARACAAAGKRLCRPAEWVAACRGPDWTTWPYGEVHQPGLCIDSGRTAPLQRLYSGADMYENRNMNDPRLNQLEGTLAQTGAAPACTNAYGVFDMVGNINEWVDDKTMRGGFYLDVEELGEGCDYATRVHSNVYNDYSTGFRCCADATPAPELDLSLLVVLLGLDPTKIAEWFAELALPRSEAWATLER